MTDVDRKFLQSLVDRVNATVPNAWRLADDRLALRSKGLDPALVDDMHDYSVQERMEYAAWFRELERTGRLPKHVIDDLLYFIKKGVTYELTTGLRKNVPYVEARPKFDFPLTQAAYTVVRLASGADIGCRVIGCKECGKFVVIDVGKKGKPRQFCSTRCQNAFGQRQKRERERAQFKSRKRK